MGLSAVALADTLLLTAEAALFIVDRVVPTSRVAAVEAEGKGSRLLLFLTGRSTLMSRAHHPLTVPTIHYWKSTAALLDRGGRLASDSLCISFRNFFFV